MQPVTTACCSQSNSRRVQREKGELSRKTTSANAKIVDLNKRSRKEITSLSRLSVSSFILR
jgi:hypothetical protein